MTDALNKLRELEKKASKAPWKHVYLDEHAEEIIEGVSDVYGGIASANHNYKHTDVYGFTEDYPEKPDQDCQLITSARNLIPAFLEFLDAIDKYGGNDIERRLAISILKEKIAKEMGE